MLSIGTGKKEKLIQLRVSEETDKNLKNISDDLKNSKNEIINSLICEPLKKYNLIKGCLDKLDKISTIKLKSDSKHIGKQLDISKYNDHNERKFIGFYTFTHYDIYIIQKSQNIDFDYSVEKQSIICDNSFQNNASNVYSASGDFKYIDLINLLLKVDEIVDITQYPQEKN